MTFSTFSATGPAAHLLALPQLGPGPLPAPSAVDEHLARTEQARQAQLDALPVDPCSVVTAAHRRTVVRTGLQRGRDLVDERGLVCRSARRRGRGGE